MTRSSSRAAAQPKARWRSRLVADHAVGGVDRLVGDDAGQSADQEPQRRRGHPVGGVFGEAFDRGAAHRRLVERLGIAPDDFRNAAASADEPPGAERGGHLAHVPIEIAARDQHGDGHDGERKSEIGNGANGRLKRKSGGKADGEQHRHGRRPGGAANGERTPRLVEPRIEEGQQRADPRHRMTDCAKHGRGISQHRFKAGGGDQDQIRCRADRTWIGT